MPQRVSGPSQKGKRTSLVKGESRPCVATVVRVTHQCATVGFMLQYLYSRFHRWNGWFARRAENHSRKTVDWGRDRGSVWAPVRSASAYCCPEHQQAATLCKAKSERDPKLLATSFFFFLPCYPETSFNFYQIILKTKTKQYKTQNECWKDFLLVRAECRKV